MEGGAAVSRRRSIARVVELWVGARIAHGLADFLDSIASHAGLA